MNVVRGYKTELDVNNEQRTACLKHAGAARFAYNWGLARSVEMYRVTGKRPSAIDLHRDLNKLKPTDYPWMYEVSKCAPQEALRDLEKAYKNFFRRCKTHALIAIEDLHVNGMLKNHCLAQAVSDSNFGEIRRQLEYKSTWHSVHLVIVDRFYPSSQTCSCCKWRDEGLTLSDRVFVCLDCGYVTDRDYNAAKNIRNVAVSSIDTQNACGQKSTGLFNRASETVLVEAGTNQRYGLSINV
jgi:IS605 OrfB family transposase